MNMNGIPKAKLAQQAIIDHANCDECLEEYIFAMKDSEHQFTIGLRTILACLSFAEEEGAVPQIPVQWWHKVSQRYQ